MSEVLFEPPDKPPSIEEQKLTLHELHQDQARFLETSGIVDKVCRQAGVAYRPKIMQAVVGIRKNPDTGNGEIALKLIEPDKEPQWVGLMDAKTGHMNPGVNAIDMDTVFNVFDGKNELCEANIIPNLSADRTYIDPAASD